MTDLSPRQRELLALLQSNRAGGLVLARSTKLAPQTLRVFNNLRRRGLVEPDSFRLTAAGLALEEAQDPEASDDRLDEARRPEVPGAAGNDGVDLLSQRSGARTAAGEDAPLGAVAGADRQHGLGHHGVAARVAATPAKPPLRLPMTPWEAQLLLQRRGRVVYRANVVGGKADRWYVSGLGRDVTNGQLVAEAEKVRDRQRA